VLVQAVRRFAEPPEVRTGPMLLFALAGLAATAASFLLLRPGAGESLNVRGAYLEVLGDMVNAAGVVVAALVIRFTGWWYADPVIAVLAAALILPRTVKLAWEAILTAARTSLHDGFHIAHATLQVEPAGADQDCRAVGW